MLDYEKMVITRFAAGQTEFREAAILAYREALKNKKPIEGPYMLFMSEADSVMPDLVLRGQYRAEVLAKADEVFTKGELSADG